jgi:hypothetical protein
VSRNTYLHFVSLAMYSSFSNALEAFRLFQQCKLLAWGLKRCWCEMLNHVLTCRIRGLFGTLTRLRTGPRRDVMTNDVMSSEHTSTSRNPLYIHMLILLVFDLFL